MTSPIKVAVDEIIFRIVPYFISPWLIEAARDAISTRLAASIQQEYGSTFAEFVDRYCELLLQNNSKVYSTDDSVRLDQISADVHEMWDTLGIPDLKCSLGGTMTREIGDGDSTYNVGDSMADILTSYVFALSCL